TAGLRDTHDAIEALGIARTREQMQKASLILYLFDLSQTSQEEIQQAERELDKGGGPYLKVGNKLDQAPADLATALRGRDFILISAKNKDNLAELKEAILNKLELNQVRPGDVLVTTLRHWQQLNLTDEALARVLQMLGGGITGDFLAMAIRQALYHLGEITGEITSDDLLANIF
ncbi:MAG TPA: tRNA uridine-5-carboxymethylaminomethyl(34) synthesis GTPase MnmE, partial [Cytophagales bacterium]|nr:tRNA uridine-5-carboxymethylaminomethyl(34) synthesis GTPase MnmE [Cytophagales bacterium]